MLAGHNRKTRTVTETGEHTERPPHDAPGRTNAPTVGAAVDPNLPVHIREQIAAVVDASDDLERVPTGSGALTVQVCSASETSYDAATWSTLGTYRAADAATLAERLLDALGDSANIGTDLGVLIVTHTHTDTLEAPAMTAPTADGTRAPAAPLLTLDLAKADVLDDDFEWPNRAARRHCGLRTGCCRPRSTPGPSPTTGDCGASSHCRPSSPPRTGTSSNS